MEKTYISGQITDTLTEDVRVKFGKAEEYLSGIGHSPVNPLNINPVSLVSWPLRLEILTGCDSIYMLCGWQEDPRSVTERFFSEITGKGILYQDSIEKNDVKILQITEAIREVAGWVPSDYRINEKGADGRSRHKGYLGRLLFAHFALLLGISLDEIKQYFDRDRTTVMCYPAKYEKEYKYNHGFREIADQVERKLFIKDNKSISF